MVLKDREAVSAGSALDQFCELGGLNKRRLFLSGGWQVEDQGVAGLVLGVDPPSVLWIAATSLCPHRTFSLAHTEEGRKIERERAQENTLFL